MLIQRLDPPLGGYAKALMKSHFTRVWKPKNVPLSLVAGCAGIEQIGVFTLPFRVDAYWHEMIQVEGSGPRIPLFAMQAVNALESEFVAKPVPIAPVILVPSRTM